MSTTFDTTGLGLFSRMPVQLLGTWKFRNVWIAKICAKSRSDTCKVCTARISKRSAIKHSGKKVHMCALQFFWKRCSSFLLTFCHKKCKFLCKCRNFRTVGVFVTCFVFATTGDLQRRSAEGLTSAVVWQGSILRLGETLRQLRSRYTALSWRYWLQP